MRKWKSEAMSGSTHKQTKGVKNTDIDKVKTYRYVVKPE